MSMHHIEQIKCPKCGKDAEFEIWNSINVDLNPEMRERVLDGTLYNFKCQHCGHEDKIAYPILYNDMTHNFMIYYCDENGVKEYEDALTNLMDNELTKEITENAKYRIVTNYFQLAEKIKIFESGLDDRMIELLKLDQIITCNKNKPENHLAFAIFDLIVNPHAKKKGPVPTLIFFNEEAEHVFDCDISIIPGAIGKIRDNYDYSEDKSFIINYEWANRYINCEKLDRDFLEISYDKNTIDNAGAKLAYGLVNLPDNETSSHYFNSLSNAEQDATVIQSGVELEELREVLKTFYRYTFFQTILRDLKKPEYHSSPDGSFRMDPDEELEFYREYFIRSMKGFEPLAMHFIKLLIHGGKLDPNLPIPYGVDNREEGPFGMYRTLKNLITEDKEETVKNLIHLYLINKDEDFSKGLKNAIIKEIFKFALPEEEIYVTDPTLASDLLNELKTLKDNLTFARRNGLAPEKVAETKETIKKQVLNIWEMSFEKHDVAACFEELASYFFDKQMYREAYLNQAFCSAYVPKSFNFMYIKKEFKAEITKEEIDAYKAKYNLPVCANSKLEEEILERFKLCKENKEYMGAIYYLNLCYNFYDERHNTSKRIDQMINTFLDLVEW